MSFRPLFVAAILVPSFATLGVAGCAGEVDPEAAPSQVALSLPSSDAALVLDLVNYPGADLSVLDEKVGLDARAAENIVETRAGADGVFPSADDDLFDDVAELDAVPYVGDGAFTKLVAYATAHPAPAAESVEGVLFRGWESEIVVWGVNRSDLGALDAMLDWRAAENLFNGRPFASVTDMGPLGYVGTTALERLRAEAPIWWAARAGGAAGLGGAFDGVTFDDATAAIAIEIANQATRDEMVANGVYAAGAAAIVGNRPYTTLAQVAGVSGVGTATMQGLHDYATSGAWAPGGGGGGGTTHTPPDPNCVFGLVYRDIFTLGGTVIIAQRVIDPGTSTNATQRSQVIAAVQLVDPEVATFSAALAAVEGSQVNHIEVWDASNRRAYTAYEFVSAGSSFGRVFEYGGTTVAANILDGEVFDCAAMWGNEMRPCPTTDDCAEGLTCFGINPDAMTGRCIDLAAAAHPQEGNDCSYELGCLPASGLVCAGAPTWGTGICVPAWMRGHFESTYSDATIPDASTAGVSLELPAYGLATVHTDVVLDLVISHPRISDLRVTLTNPATAEIVIHDGPAWGINGTELVRKNYVVHGFSGDEQANGQWTLTVVDSVTGQTGQVLQYGLTITSRWD